MLKIKSYFFCKIFTPESYERCLDRILNNPNDAYLDCLHICHFNLVFSNISKLDIISYSLIFQNRILHNIASFGNFWQVVLTFGKLCKLFQKALEYVNMISKFLIWIEINVTIKGKCTPPNI